MACHGFNWMLMSSFQQDRKRPSEDSQWELSILATVQGFYEKLLQEHIEGEVPVPAGLEAISLQEAEDDVRGTLHRMQRWLRLLDMAITPAILRGALTQETDPEIAEAMIRYFARRQDGSGANRDKMDLVATFLYRHPRVPGQWEKRGYGLDGSLPLSPFEIALIEILADVGAPDLADEHVQILREFDSLNEEASAFQELNTLLESEIIPRVRGLKESLGASFFHPGALATIASYNVAFGRKFDELFLKAAADIKRFASALEEQGGDILGNVDGVDVTVEHVAGLQESDLLRIDYATAQEKFRRVSRLRKILQQNPPVRLAPRLVRTPPKAQPADSAPLVADLAASQAAVTPQQISGEEAKLLRIEESIRSFVRVADVKFRQVVPMRYFNLVLSPAEADAFCADYLQEKSLRAGVARVLLRLVAVLSRMTVELEELQRAESSLLLRQLHADSLIVLLEIGRTVDESARRVIHLLKQRGDAEELSSLESSMKKLTDCARRVKATLTAPPRKSSTVAAGR
jgi:hypothetical protein